MSYSATIIYQGKKLKGNVFSYKDRESAILNSQDFSITRYLDKATNLGKWRYYYRSEEVRLIKLEAGRVKYESFDDSLC